MIKIIPTKLKQGIISSLILGCLLSSLIFLMIQTLLAQVILDLILPYTTDAEGMFNIFLIFMLIESIGIVISIIVPFFMEKIIPRWMIYASASLGLLSMLLLWFSISFLTTFFLYPEIYEGLEGYDIIKYSPIIIVYYGIYVVGDITVIWWFTIITYYIFYALFLYLFARNQSIRRIEVVYKW